MAKQITQETFNGVVTENMEEFDMTAQEAVADAQEQFQAQGVDLSNIVQDLSLYSTSDSSGDTAVGKHPLVAAIETLTSAVEASPPNPADVKTACAKIQSGCQEDFAHRALAASNKAYPVLVSAVEATRADPGLLESPIGALCALCNGQPDLLDEKSTDLFVELLKSQQANAALVTSLVKLIRLTCIMHESNRQAYVARDIIPLYVSTLEAHKDSAEVVKEVCFALRVLTFDDDMRVPFGKAHEHAKMIVTEADALKKILAICKAYSEDVAVLGELFSTLSRLAVRNEFCQEIMDLGGLQLMLDALTNNSQHQGINKQVLGVMKAVSGNDDVKVAICKAGGIQQILGAVSRHQMSPVVCHTGCAALASLALRQLEHGQQIMEADGPEVIAKAMQLHPGDADVQMQACMAIRNVVARARQHNAAFLEAGVEPLIRRALETHGKTCGDEAKASLRDLDCKVELKERWTGEGKGIQY